MHLGALSIQPDSPGSSVFDLPTQPLQAHPDRPINFTKASDVSNIDGQDLSFVVISGGTGGNAICSAFGNASYILPVSDDGGSSSEIIRVLGGPSIGDIRAILLIAS